jgi:hypothetical protein
MLAMTRLRLQGGADASEGRIAEDPFALRDDEFVTEHLHQVAEPESTRAGRLEGAGAILCDTDAPGSSTPGGLSPLEIVLDATDGFIPLWDRDTTLKWRFKPSTLAGFKRPDLARAEIERLLAEGIRLWGDAVPVRFSQSSDDWDFEIVVRDSDRCDPNGCVLASAFFPDAGRHELVLYPKMFGQAEQEQIETLAHELGHVFGLRHFFAQLSEQQWPSVLWGQQSRFTIMNYGGDSRMTDADRSDLRALYEAVWDGRIKEINGTKVRLFRPYHSSGRSPDGLPL